MLLTTPESPAAMLVSTQVDHRAFFSGLRSVVVDEVQAFAGDDRGWHLLAVLERLQHVIGRPVQRIGLSATVGNPRELLDWLQGSGLGRRPGRVVAPGVALPDTRVGVAPSSPPRRLLDDRFVRLRDDVTPQSWRTAVADAATGLTLPDVDPHAVRGLRFAEALPVRLAEATLAARLGDADGARAALAGPVRFLLSRDG